MKPSTKRLVSFTVAVLLALGALVIFFNLIQPAYRETQMVKAQILSKEISLANEKRATEQVQALLEQYRGSQSPQAALSAALPLESDQARVLHEIGQLAAMHRLAVQSVSVSQPGSKPLGPQMPRAAAASSSAALVKPVGVIAAQVRVAGPYAAFKSFLTAVETNIQLTDVSSLVVSPVGESRQDFYTFDLTLTTYYQNP